MNNLARWWLLGAAVIVVSASVYRVVSQSAGEATSREPEDEKAASFIGQALQAGDIHRYGLELKTSLSAAGGTVMEYSLSGIWVVTVLESNSDGATLQGYVDGAVLAAEGQATAGTVVSEQMQAAADGFKSPLTYRLDARGALEHVLNVPSQELQVRTMMRALAAASQVVRSGDEKKEWQAEERDGTGSYIARYVATDGQHLVKSKLHYTKLGQQAGSANRDERGLEVVSSTSNLTLHTSGLLVGVESRERLKATGETFGGVETRTNLKLEWLGTSVIAPTTVAAMVAKLPEVGAAPDVYEEQSGYSLGADRTRIAGRGFRDFIDIFDSLPANPESLTEAQKTMRRHAFIGLAAKFRRDPGAVGHALNYVQESEASTVFIWDALGSAGTAEAQAALHSIIDMPRWSRDERLAQMISLSMGDHPSVETVDFLEAKLDDPEQHLQARYGLGTAAARLKLEDPMAAAEIVETLVERLETSKNPHVKADYLAALGNAGHQDALEVLAEQLSNPIDRIRASALNALRFMEGEEVDGMVAKALLTDQDDSVRRMAASTAAYRVPPSQELLHALGRAWQRDPESSVRRRAHATLLGLDSQFQGLLGQIREAYPPLQ